MDRKLFKNTVSIAAVCCFLNVREDDHVRRIRRVVEGAVVAYFRAPSDYRAEEDHQISLSREQGASCM